MQIEIGNFFLDETKNANYKRKNYINGLHQNFFKTYFKKNAVKALTSMAQFVGHHSTEQKVTGSTPGHGSSLGASAPTGGNN